MSLAIDKNSEQFLTSSNLAFDEKQRTIENFVFYNLLTGELDLTNVNYSDPIEVSLFEYLQSYGYAFSPDLEEEKMNHGLEFEKIMCIAFDDNFQEYLPSYADSDRSISAQISDTLSKSKLSKLGQSKSQGADIFSYRVSCVLGDNNG
jgi:hypothetical protein